MILEHCYIATEIVTVLFVFSQTTSVVNVVIINTVFPTGFLVTLLLRVQSLARVFWKIFVTSEAYFE
jgi:hypothetical protein